MGERSDAQVAERITQMQLRGDGVLNLSLLNLTKIPDIVLQASGIRTLNLFQNAIHNLPNLTSWLPNLEVIDLRENPVTKIADQPHLWLDGRIYVRVRGQLTPTNIIGLDLLHPDVALIEDATRLTSLRRLCVDQGRFGALPDCLQRLSSLVRLELHGCNHLTSLPEWLPQLASLQLLSVYRGRLGSLPTTLEGNGALLELNLSDNLIREFPEQFVCQSTNLRLLNLSNNQIVDLPEALSRLTCLQSLILYANQIERVPESFGRLISLERLFLNANPLKELPPSVVELPRLRELWLTDTAPSNVPPELMRGRDPVDLHRLRSYFRELRSAGLDYICEAKLLLVGEGDAGKTSFARKLVDPNCALRSDEPSTEGIDVLDWSFPAKIPIRERDDTRYIDREIRVRIWDFAGQEITHATHQFFLTRRSLYALVVDTRRDNPNFDYWLSIVELLSDGSPLLLVKNEKQDAACLINDGAARARFPQLKEVLAVNLASNRGLDAVVAAVRGHLQTLPHIGAPLPASWKRVREALEDRPENYISSETFHTLCDACGFFGRGDQLQLSGYLHDLGVFLHFQNDDALSHLIFLKPEWVTRSVYRVLRDREVTERQGRFKRGELHRIWSGSAYGPVRGALLELMRKFRLCYPLTGTDEYIIPQLLPRNQPEYSWDVRDNLQVQYHYDFMPKGIVPRLIVALHRAIERQAWVWQEGVVLARDQARAEVLENSWQRSIHVRLAGNNRLQLLGAIGMALDDIHAAYPKLLVWKRVPCSCADCTKASKPHFFDAAALRGLAEKGRAQSQCPVSGDMISVRALLASVGDEVAPMLAGDVLATRKSAHHSLALNLDPRGHGSTALHIVPGQDSSSSVYVSYAWGGESERIVDELEQAFAARRINIIRDKKDVSYKCSRSRPMMGCRSRSARGAGGEAKLMAITPLA